MHWWPRQTPKSGRCGPNVRIISLDSPASLREQGPGEIKMRAGFNSRTRSTEI